MFQFFFSHTVTNQLKNDPHLLYYCDSGAASTFMPRTMHTHNDRLEILYIASGSGYYFIGDRKYIAHKGDILVINPDTLHDESEEPNSKMKVYCCGVSGVSLLGLPANHLIPTDASPVIHTGALEPHISNIFTCMYEQVIKHKEQAVDVCTPLLIAMIALIQQIPVATDTPVVTKNQFDLADRIKLCLDEYYHENRSLDSMAESMRMSVSYLAHAFKDTTGYPPGQYMIRRRIGEAQTLLITTKQPVTQISTMVGYDNTNYFSTLFSKVVGLAPKEYRNYWCGT